MKFVYKFEIYFEVVKLLVEEGFVNEVDFFWDSDGYKVLIFVVDIIDGIVYDGCILNVYLESLLIGLKFG